MTLMFQHDTFFIDVDIYILRAAMNEQWEVGFTAQGVG